MPIRLYREVCEDQNMNPLESIIEQMSIVQGGDIGNNMIMQLQGLNYFNILSTMAAVLFSPSLYQIDFTDVIMDESESWGNIMNFMI